MALVLRDASLGTQKRVGYDSFCSKPDVIRIDNVDKLHYTSFCVAQNGGGPTPYTDKVISFATHLINDEKAFVKSINRIREDTLEKMPECAFVEL